jgi:hypothetical protein
MLTNIISGVFLNFKVGVEESTVNSCKNVRFKNKIYSKKIHLVKIINDRWKLPMIGESILNKYTVKNIFRGKVNFY